MMRKRVVGIMLAVALLVGGGFWLTQALAHTWGEPGHGRAMRRHGRHGHHKMRILRQLDLTDEQKEKAREIMTATRKQAIQLRADLRIARLELREKLSQDTVDRATVDQSIERIGELRQQLLRQRVDTRLNMQAMLTPEQRAKARELHMDHMLEEGRGRPLHDRKGSRRYHRR